MMDDCPERVQEIGDILMPLSHAFQCPAYFFSQVFSFRFLEYLPTSN